jgi:gamma-glutamylcyclotransferase (GGCT)/AIG2-like uncharacterized protein YtfP
MANRKQKEKDKVSYYFAYGSNMNHEHMKMRCPKSQYIEPYTLEGHELVFRGVADVQPSKDKSVTGALFKITPDCERSLDIYEGYPNLYTKKYHWQFKDNKDIRIMFYSMVDKQVVYPPFQGYLNTIIGGYQDCGLSTDPLKEAVNFSVQRLD